MLAMYLYCMLVNNSHINKGMDIPYKEIISNVILSHGTHHLHHSLGFGVEEEIIIFMF